MHAAANSTTARPRETKGNGRKNPYGVGMGGLGLMRGTKDGNNKKNTILLKCMVHAYT